MILMVVVLTTGTTETKPVTTPVDPESQSERFTWLSDSYMSGVAYINPAVLRNVFVPVSCG
jgi:hypothetical protein